MSVFRQSAAAIDTASVVRLASEISAIESPLANETAVANVLARELDHPRIDLYMEEVVVGRSNLIARVRGGGDRAPLVLSGHTDASIYPHGWTNDPYLPWIDNGRLYGAGVDDMKGAVAAMTAAVRAAADFDGLPGDLLFHAVMHHDTIGLGEKYILASEGPTEGFGICGEPSNLAIHTANSGAIRFEVELTGAPAHISHRHRGKDALRAAVRVYDALDAIDLPFEPCDRLPDMPQMILGQLIAGDGAALVADKARITGDIRSVPGMDRSLIRNVIDQAVQAACPEDIGARVRITAVQKPFIGVESGLFVDTLARSHEAIFGTRPTVTNEMPGQAFVTDAADMAHFGLETVVYGVGDWTYGPDQSVDLQELGNSARVYLAVAAALGTPEDRL